MGRPIKMVLVYILLIRRFSHRQLFDLRVILLSETFILTEF